MPDYVEIRVKGQLDKIWSKRFAGLEIFHLKGNETLLSGFLPDQAALHGVLESVRDLNLTLMSVSRGREPLKNIKEKKMNTTVISYSYTGNNDALASKFVKEIGANHIRITESNNRTTGTIILDLIFNRKPKITMHTGEIEKSDIVIFIGPVWIGQVATPFRSCFKQLKHRINKYAFISLSGGADGPDCNNKLPNELKKRLGKEPQFLIDFHVTDLLPSEPKPTREDTSQYRINDKDLEFLINSIKTTTNLTPPKEDYIKKMIN